MTAFPSLPLFTDSFIADTGHLSAQETGAYLMLLMMAWRLPEGRIPDDDAKLSRWARVNARQWAHIKKTVMEFWVLADGFWTQKRLSRELVRVREFAERSRDNGKHGGRPKSLKNNDTENPAGSSRVAQKKAPSPIKTISSLRSDISDANASSSETSSDTLANETPKRRKRVSYPPDFEAFWTAFPTDALMSKKAAGLVWSRMSEDVRQLAMASLPAFRAYCTSKPDYRPVHAVRYLTQERFVGFSEVVSKAAGKVFVAKGTPQWTAWQRVQHSSCVTSAEHRQDGWWFESEWPNGEHSDERKTA